MLSFIKKLFGFGQEPAQPAAPYKLEGTDALATSLPTGFTLEPKSTTPVEQPKVVTIKSSPGKVVTLKAPIPAKKPANKPAANKPAAKKPAAKKQQFIKKPKASKPASK